MNIADLRSYTVCIKDEWEPHPPRPGLRGPVYLDYRGLRVLGNAARIKGWEYQAGPEMLSC